MTSNVGATKINKKNNHVLGFGTNKDREEEIKDKYDTMKENMMAELKKKFKPEFLNRIDDIIVFHPLEEYHIFEIVKLMTREVIQRLESINIHLDISEDAVRLIAKEGLDLEYGARPLKRAIQKELEDTLSEAILRGDVKKGSNIIAVIENNKIVYKYKICMNI
jgi:ATP-dependent Clp protease ATP-binding subunit ClpC